MNNKEYKEWYNNLLLNHHNPQDVNVINYIAVMDLVNMAPNYGLNVECSNDHANGLKVYTFKVKSQNYRIPYMVMRFIINTDYHKIISVYYANICYGKDYPDGYAIYTHTQRQSDTIYKAIQTYYNTVKTFAKEIGNIDKVKKQHYIELRKDLLDKDFK